MSALTYIPPETPSQPFKKGDTVEVLDREHVVLAECKIVRIESGRITTDCGRQWRSDGWWRGETGAWPFPSIRHKV